MKKWIALGLCAAFLAGCNEIGDKSALVTEKDNYSYALGANFGMQAHGQLVARDSIELDLNAFFRGFKDRYYQDSSKYLLNDSAVIAVLNEFSQKLQHKKIAKDSAVAAQNLADQEAFLAKNKTAEGVVTTESGLQ